MSEERDDVMAVELLLLEPEIVAWLDDYRLQPEDVDDEDPPPHAA
jgi:hypothetical protein